MAAITIASEAPENDAFVVYGEGPQIRIYCVFGEDAVSGDGVNEESLAKVPTNGDWHMSLPCLAEDLDWTNKKLKNLSSRIRARAVGESVEYEETPESNATRAVILNLGEFLKS